MDEFTIAARFVHFAAVMVLLGASLFRAYIGRAASAEGDDVRARAVLERFLRKVLLRASALAVLSALAWLDSQAVSMSEGWRDAVNVDALAAVLLETEFGHLWIWHLALGVTLIVCLWLLRTRPRTGLTDTVVIGLSAALVGSLALTGHTALASGATRALHIATQAVHLTVAAIWLGGLVPLGFVLANAAKVQGGAWRALARRALPRFSRIGYGAVGLVLVTGIINTAFVVGSLDGLIRTAHGRVLIVKVLLVVLMIAVAIVNRLVLAPRVMGLDATGAVSSSRALWRTVVVEQVLGLFVIAAVSVLGTLHPAF